MVKVDDPHMTSLRAGENTLKCNHIMPDPYESEVDIFHGHVLFKMEATFWLYRNLDDIHSQPSVAMFISGVFRDYGSNHQIPREIMMG